MSHCCWSTAKLGSSGKSSEAKVTVADLLCRTLHSFWPCFHSCPPFPHTVDAQHYSLFVPSRLSFSFFFSRTHTVTLPRSSYFHSLLASILVNLLSSPTASWSIGLAAPSLLRCPISDASSSLPHPLCLLLAVSSSLPYPCCLILAASPSLQRPRSNFSSSHPSHC